MAWIDRQGKVQPLPIEPREFGPLSLSHDGKRMAVTVSGANNVLWAYDLERGQPTRLTFRLDVEGTVWTADDRRVTHWRQRR
jgi:hypothetical protein